MASHHEKWAGDVREWRCDLSSCGVRREARKPLEAGMMTLVTPEVGFMPAGKRHFCSLECLRTWSWQATGTAGNALPVLEPLVPRREPRTLGEMIAAGEVPANAGSWSSAPRDSLDADDDGAPDVPPLYPDGDAPGRVVSAREYVPRRSSVSE